MKYDTWVVAAAILANNPNKALHYTTITDRILETNLTTLGQKGRTPQQSLGSILRGYPNVFRRHDMPGFYYLINVDKIAKLDKVAQVINLLHKEG